ncbi:MAG: dockerin type I repeat-containing protein [Phycisphaerae bacterium]|nr:dockerin type I repeat-containing protein [Phycisphaerae bacterium]
MMKVNIALGLVSSLALTSVLAADVQTFTATGDAAAIQGSVDAFRTALGPLNGNVPGSFGGGRREINWDAVPDTLSSPNLFPGAFFNFTAAPRARGASFATTGNHFEVSAKLGNPTSTPVEFGNIDPNYVESFSTFSPQRLFASVGSTSTTATFFVPGTVTVPAQLTGFGVVFTDVDGTGTTITAFDKNDDVIGTLAAPAAPGNGQLSFAAMVTTSANRIARIEIVSGTLALGAGNLDNPRSGADVVAMDDFIYGEPISLNCPYDLNGDGEVSASDLAFVLGAWDQTGALPADLNGDGVVDSYDLAYILGSWGPCGG